MIASPVPSPEAANAFARQFSVVPDLHSEDFIYRFVAQHPNYPTQDAALGYYFATGRQSAEYLKELLVEFKLPLSSSIFEFASGYGCVTRHLSNLLSDATVTACDIHPAAVEFIRERIGIRAILSAHRPEDLKIDQTFDVVFALSFFSHMPRTTWGRWLQTLARLTRAKGLVIFTTHGLKTWTIRGCPQLDDDGFRFNPGSEQQDLDKEEYGGTITTFDFVYRHMASISDVRLIKFREGFWWGHQDLYVLLRS